MATIDTIADRSSGSAIAGKAYFETSTNKFIVYNGTAWIELDSDGTGAVYENRWGASFDGSDDYLELPIDGTSSGGVLASSDADIDLTISMWIKPLTAASGNGEGIFGWQPALSSANPMITATTIRIFLDGAFRHTWQAGEMDDFTWNNLIITRTASDNTWRGYVKGNASPVFSHDDGGSITNRANASAIYLANQYFGYGNVLLDEVAVFNSVLSTSDVTDIYNSGVPSDLTSLNPTGYWRMGDDSNDTATAGGAIATITDSSGNGYDATQSTASNQPTFKALAQSATSVSFDGSNDFITSDPNITHASVSSYTMSAWLNFTSFVNGGGVYQMRNGQSASDWTYNNFLRVDSATSASFLHRGSGGYTACNYTGITLSLNTWYNFTQVWDGTNVKLYLDGALISTTTTTNTASFAGRSGYNIKFDLGKGRASNSYPCKIDEFAWWDSDKSSSISDIYNSGVPSDLSSLSPFLYLRMGEDDSLTDGASVSQITDASGNGNHATQATAANQPTASIDPVIYV